MATNIISALLLPPLNCILLCVLGLALRRRRPRLGLTLSMTALATLAIFSTVAGSRLLVLPLETQTDVLVLAKNTRAQAIVVLGGGRLSDAPEYGGRAMPGEHTLARILYAARLHRLTALPVLVSGGAPDGAPEAEAVTMARVMTDEFAVPVRWREQRSNTTAENAALTAKMLGPEGIERILLVTDAMHMPRAKAIFEQNGFAVVAAPTLFLSRDRLTFSSFLPGGKGLQRTYSALHEWLGLLWYRVRYPKRAPP